MKGIFFNKPLEWNLETHAESWSQGDSITGTLKVKNHGADMITLSESGVALAHAEIKKVHSRTEGAFKIDAREEFQDPQIAPQETKELSFTLTLPPNCVVTDKKASYFLSYGRNFSESHLQLKIGPKALFNKIIGLLDTFHRFKLKEIKAGKNGVEYKLLPPTSREMANLESLNLIFSMDQENLKMDYDFQVRKLDTASVTTKVNKASVKLQRILSPKEFSLGQDMINQDQLLKSLEGVLNEVKLKSVF